MRRATTLLAGLVLAWPLHAVDWGADLSEVPLLLSDTAGTLVNSVSARFWLSSPLGGPNLRIEGVGAHSLSVSGGVMTAAPSTADLTVLSLNGTTPVAGGASGVVEWTVGRHDEIDNTGGWIINSPWDGFNLGWQIESFRLSLAAGYSGLLFKKRAADAMSAADSSDLGDGSVLFGPRRLLGSLGLTWNELAFRQDLSVELDGQGDLRDLANGVHTAYLTLQAAGPLPGGFRHRTFVTASAARAAGAAESALLTGGELTDNLPFLGTRVAFTGTLGTGSGASGFRTISGNSLSDVVNVTSAGAGSLKLDLSIRPFSKTVVGLKANELWRVGSVSIAVPGFDGAGSPWLGTELSLYGNWNPMPELLFGWVGGVFLPNGGSFAPGTGPTLLAVLTSTMKL